MKITRIVEIMLDIKNTVFFWQLYCLVGKLIQLILNTLEALILAAMLLELLEVNPEKNKNSENLHEHRV